jgi:hypothetical protein
MEAGVTNTERELARYRKLLEKKYTNHKGGYEYICEGTKIMLTPYLMQEWCTALVRQYYHWTSVLH